MDEVGPHRRGWGYQVGRKDGIESSDNADDPHTQRRFVVFRLAVAAVESNGDRAFSRRLTSILQNPMCLAASSEDEMAVESEREGHSSFEFPQLQQGLRNHHPNHPVFLQHLRELRRDALQSHLA